MANLPEEEKWEDVYQWETSDRALGGPGGVMNKPLRNLTNRTAFLKKQLDENTGQATTTKAGIVKLSNLTDSSSKTEAATPSAVKAVYDLAAGKLSKDGNLSDLTDVALALQNLGLGDTVKLSDYTFGDNARGGWARFPNGMIYQWGMSSYTNASSPLVNITYPIPFPNGHISVHEHDVGGGDGPSVTIWQFLSLSRFGFTASNIGTLYRGSATLGGLSSSACLWTAWGR